ncbi:ROK family protein [Mycolicibacter terrae]|uniref:ROK family protein n=1 Tax=Mycolicibacter terrae TaxID=1788 RepID=A0ACD2ERR8_9MYCO|nr:ROK family protein [Mycolicibacter terrae]RRR47705.1 ROK family protein [Mycolicibacter terrae]
MTGTDSTAVPTGAPAAATAGTGPLQPAFGVDVGGSGIKGGVVDLATGALVGERYKLPTPSPATPAAVAETVAAVVRHFGWTGPLGVTYPGVVIDGVVQTAANVDKSWIGVNAQAAIAAALDGQPVVILNDADAAGLAEERFGAGKDNTGVVVLLTFGTGIGSAVIHNGKLLPNTELGHIDVDGKEAEHRAAASVKERKNWSMTKWSKQVTKVLVAIENALCPDLIIVGGGISRKADQWVPLLGNRTPVVAATLQNTAGIVGAAMASATDVTR